MRVVFDTNVLLAAFLTEGLCAKLLIRARKRNFDLFLCPCLLTEFKRVLTKKFKANHEETAATLALLSEAVHSVITPETQVTGVCRDRDDDQVLACAHAAEADYLVTGDEDLLVLRQFEDTCILNPRDFEALMEE